VTKISARVKYPSRSTRLTMTACREYCQLLILALYVCGLDCNFVWVGRWRRNRLRAQAYKRASQSLSPLFHRRHPTEHRIIESLSALELVPSQSTPAIDIAGPLSPRRTCPYTHATMGMVYRIYLEGERIYGCANCKTHLATIHSMMSRVSIGSSSGGYAHLH
jgi:hypothetical protein